MQRLPTAGGNNWGYFVQVQNVEEEEEEEEEHLKKLPDATVLLILESDVKGQRLDSRQVFSIEVLLFHG